jgi:hypothetical protein
MRWLNNELSSFVRALSSFNGIGKRSMNDIDDVVARDRQGQ